MNTPQWMKAPGVELVIMLSYAVSVMFGMLLEHYRPKAPAVDSVQFKANPISYKDGGFWLEQDELEKIMRDSDRKWVVINDPDAKNRHPQHARRCVCPCALPEVREDAEEDAGR